MEYKVFISYSRTNSAERCALVCELSKIKLDPLYDKGEISPGTGIHEKISELIDQADCVVTMLTEDGLKSREVREELTRAHERHKKIIPIVDRQQLTKFPLSSFLQDVDHIPYNRKDFDSVITALIPKLTLEHYLKLVIEKVERGALYVIIDPRFKFLSDPQQVYIEPKCITWLPSMGLNSAITVKDFVKDADKDERPVLILGNYGMGKSFFVREYVIEHAHSRIGKNDARIPIFYPLRRFSEDGGNIPIVDHLKRYIKSEYKSSVWEKNDFSELLKKGRLLVVLDGIDEIPFIQDSDPLEYLRDFRELLKEGHNQLIVTSRPGLFSTQREEINQLDWNQCEIQPWSDEDIKQYIFDSQTALQNSSPENFVNKILKTSNLAKLAKTPLYACMMLVASDEIMHLDGETITVTSLYNRFTEQYFKANENRSIFKKKIATKMKCLEVVAWHMFSKNEKMTRCEELRGVLNRELLSEDSSTLFEFLETELGVYSLMILDDEKRLRFSHDSFHPYFAARYLANSLQKDSSELLRLLEKNRLTRDAIKFLAGLLVDKQEDVSELRHLLSASKPEKVKSSLALLIHEMGSDLNYKDLDDVVLSGEDLSGMRANHASLNSSFLIGTTLKGADFQNASFRQTDLSGAYVDGANFRGCDLSMAIVKNLKAGSSPPWFSGATFNYARMSSKDLNLIKSWLYTELSNFPDLKSVIKKTEKSLDKAAIL